MEGANNQIRCSSATQTEVPPPPPSTHTPLHPSTSHLQCACPTEEQLLLCAVAASSLIDLADMHCNRRFLEARRTANLALALSLGSSLPQQPVVLCFAFVVAFFHPLTTWPLHLDVHAFRASR